MLQNTSFCNMNIKLRMLDDEFSIDLIAHTLYV